MAQTQGLTRGRRVVLTIYVIVVAIAALTGLILGTFVSGDILAPKFLGIIPFPPTPLGLAAYGGLTLAVVLGVVLGLVIYVSDRYVE
ncbi:MULTISPECIES: cox cluster protein [unclassified Haladaptatus]|uniref:DUF7520 family protein n=1 Tax=unclassified Haladaptatus TaxID=2622732 RepID=UPI0023E81C57|nr:MULTISPECIES: cox cluster protein [unclassified Haladaptatus]